MTRVDPQPYRIPLDGPPVATDTSGHRTQRFWVVPDRTYRRHALSTMAPRGREIGHTQPAKSIDRHPGFSNKLLKSLPSEGTCVRMGRGSSNGGEDNIIYADSLGVPQFLRAVTRSADPV